MIVIIMEVLMIHKIRGVPYYTQYQDVPREWVGNSSTMACLRMAMEHVLKERVPTTGDLYDEALAIQNAMVAQDKTTRKATKAGLLHKAVVLTAHNHGVAAHEEEFDSREFYKNEKTLDRMFTCNCPFRSAMYRHGLRRISKSISNNSPVIVSVKKDFNPIADNHSVLLVGADEGSGFWYYDPNLKPEDMTEKVEPTFDRWFVPLVAFEQCWRRLAIFVDNIE
jgi:hypothetical protein